MRRGANVAAGLILVLLIAPARALQWDLEEYKLGCGSLDLIDEVTADSRNLPGSMTFDSDADLLWVSIGRTLRKVRYSTGETLDTVDLSLAVADSTRKLGSDESSVAALGVGLAAMDGARVAITNRQDPGILVYGTDAATGSLALQKRIPTFFVFHTLTYDAAYDVFYAVPAGDLQSVVRVDSAGGLRPMFGGGSQAGLLLEDDPITDIHYAANTGTLFVLCADCDTAFEVTLSGNVRSSNARDLRGIGAPVVGLSFARTGSPMLLMTEGLQVLALCQDIELGLPVLPPEPAYSPPPQTWFSLDTYLFCGAWQFDEVVGATLTDMTVDPNTRTVWALVDGALVEYGLRGAVLRRQSREDLAALGLTGVSSVAWMGRGKLLLGMREGNVVAVVDTVPPEVASNVVRLVALDEAHKSGAETVDAEWMEPAGADAEEDAVRLANRLAVDSKASIAVDLLPPNSLGAIAYDSEKQRVIAASFSRLGLVWSSLDGKESGEVLSTVDAVAADAITSIDSFVYDPVEDELLLWCESCAQLREVSSSPDADVAAQRTFPLLQGDEAKERASSFTVTPEGSMLMLGGNAGEVTFYCSTGKVVSDDDIIRAVREGQDADVDPSYFWKSQRLSASAPTSSPTSAATTSSPASASAGVSSSPASSRSGGDGEVVYEYTEQLGCKDPTLGDKITSVTVSECEDMCTANSACTAFTYNTRKRSCFLKATCVNAQPNEDDFTGRKGGPVIITTRAAVSFSTLFGVLCNDATLAVIPSVEMGTCEALCAGEPSCGAFTYTTTTSACALKASCDDKSVSVSNLSGVKNGGADDNVAPTPAPTSPPTTPPPSTPSAPQTPGQVTFTRLDGIGCTTDTIERKRRVSLEGCEDLCVADANCGAYTYNTVRRICYMKRDCDDRKDEGDNVSGVKRVSSFVILQDVKCTGSHLVTVNNLSPLQCEAACEVNFACVAFTHDPFSRCLLKKACDQIPLAGYLTGVRVQSDNPTPAPTTSPPLTPAPTTRPPATPAPTAAPPNSVAFQYINGLGCEDGDVAVIKEIPIDECAAACSGTPDCRFFTFNIERSKCFLKNTCDERKDDDNNITGVKIVDDTPTGPTPAPTPSPTTAPPSTPSPPTRPPLTPAPTPSPTTSPPSTPSPTTRPPLTPAPTAAPPSGGFFQYISGMGCDDTNVATIKDVSPETCENRCLLEPACRFFTYNLDKSKCFLKPTCEEREDKDNNFTGVKLEDAPTDPPSTPAPTTRPPVSPTPAPTLPPLSPTPAPTTAAPTLPPSPVTFEVTDGVGCDDDTLERYSDFTMEECERACEANSECRVFTFNTDNERCYLKATCDDIKVEDDNDTGVKVMFDYVYAKGCDDDDVAVIRDISEGACEEACRGDPSCRYFVFNLDNGKCFLKGACDQPKDDIDNLTGVKVAIALDLPSPDPIGENPDDPGEGALVGGWEWRDDQDCTPWEGRECGLSANPGLKIGDITWYRMYAHKANPLRNRGNGVLEWTPYRERRDWGAMYYKGSEIIGYFDRPMSIDDVGAEVEVAFLWSSEGESQPDICPGRTAKDVDCERCEEEYLDETGEKHIYHEVRCFSGTGDFRVALTDSTRGERITKDGYGYWNEDVVQYRGVQWRFHPHACPEVPRERPHGYAAVAASSWIRDNIKPREPNSQGLVLDFVENDDLGDRSFKSRMFDPADDGACLNLPNGDWTPEDKPFKMRLQYKGRSGGKVEFDWRMEFNGWTASKTEEWDEDLFPSTIDSIVVGYTNPRSYTSLKLLRVA